MSGKIKDEVKKRYSSVVLDKMSSPKIWLQVKTKFKLHF